MKNAIENRLKKAAAVVLSLIMVAGFAGCDMFGVRKAQSAMNYTLTNFNKALNELDYETVRSLSDWTEDDSDYKAVEELFDTSYYGDEEGEGFVACTEYIASTITINFNLTSVAPKGSQASVNVKYEMVDWQQVYEKTHGSYDEVLEDLKNCQDKTTVDAVVVLENVDGENDWRLCQINDLATVMSFVHTLPEIDVLE